MAGYRNANQQEKLQQLTDRLQEGVKDVFESERYAEYLRVMAKFPRYSFRNTLLIAMQNPNATMVAGYTKWQEIGRQVNRGEKAIQILAPTPYKRKKEMQVFDPDTHQPVRNDDGSIKTEEVEVTIPAFRAVSVFDISQTQGREIPNIVQDLVGDVNGYRNFMKAMEMVSPVPIGLEEMDGKDGYYDQREKVVRLRIGMSEKQTVAAVIHEVSHAKLHRLDMDNLEESLKERGKDKRTMEVEAESIAYVVSQYYGIETGENSFGYIAGWSKNKELPELQASLETIRSTAAELIDGLDEVLDDLRREQELIDAKEDRFAIYQLSDDAEDRREIAFISMAQLEKNGLKPMRENYRLIYSGTLQEGDSLEGIFERFNVDRPEDFRGHSLSVSDIVVTKREGQISTHYVDSFGFTELPYFLDLKKNAYMPLAKVEELEEANYNMIDNILNNRPLSRESIRIEYYASVCDEFHDMKAFYHSENLAEILEKYRQIRNEPELSYLGNGFGVIWHDAENPQQDGTEITLISERHITGDHLDQAAFMAAEPAMQELVRELHRVFPEYTYTPPREVQEALYPEHMTTEVLAGALLDLSRDQDFYQFQDSVADEETALQELRLTLMTGQGYTMLPFLKDAIEDGGDDAVRAEYLAEKIRTYQPEVPKDMEPLVRVQYCESGDIDTDHYWKLSELDEKTAELDRELSGQVNAETGEPEKTAAMGFTIYYAGEAQVESLSGMITAGNGDGGLIASIRAANDRTLSDEDWMKFQKDKGEAEFSSYMAEMIDVQEKVLPYLQSFYSLEERAPEKTVVEQPDNGKTMQAMPVKGAETKGALKQGSPAAQKKSIHERLAEKKLISAQMQGKDNKEKGVELA